MGLRKRIQGLENQLQKIRNSMHEVSVGMNSTEKGNDPNKEILLVKYRGTHVRTNHKDLELWYGGQQQQQQQQQGDASSFTTVLDNVEAVCAKFSVREYRGDGSSKAEQSVSCTTRVIRQPQPQPQQPQKQQKQQNVMKNNNDTPTS